MNVDVAVIGGGIAGLSCAAFLAPRASVAVIEMERAVGYHSTGRSAAIYTECYGAEPIRRLSIASKPYFLDRPDPFATPLGVMFIARQGDRSSIDDFYRVFSPLVPELEVLSPREVAGLVSVIDEEATSGAVFEPGAFDLDVHGILTSFAAAVRVHHGTILTSSLAHGILRTENRWHIEAGNEIISAHTLVNAAGAWGDHVASAAGVKPIGLTPFKRSAFTFDPGFRASDWPMIVDIDENWYLKPEGPLLLGSAASEIQHEPADAKHDELDIALGIQRISEATTLTIRSVRNQWAGLRTFTPDRTPAVGFERTASSFFWLVGQGGYGIHTSPAMGAMAAGLILDGRISPELGTYGLTAEMFDPSRFR